MGAKALGSFETSLCVTDTNHLGHVDTSQAKFSHPVSVRLGNYGKTEQEKYFQKGKFWEKRGTESRKQAV